MRCLTCLFFLFLINAVYGQEIFPEKNAKLITEFPFKQLNGGVVLIKARFNDIPDSLNFVLDTGSGGISLDSSTVDKYKIPNVPSGKYIYGIAGVHKVNYSRHNHLYFPNLKVDSLDFYINNYDILTSVYGIKIDGIIGYSFLSRYIVKVNYDSLRISVYEPGKIDYPARGYTLHPSLKGIPVVPLLVKDAKRHKANFYFDTGAGLCFIVTTKFKTDSALLLKKRKPLPIEVQGLGGRKEMGITIVKELQIGDYKFRRVPTYILEDEYNIFAYPAQSGLIGSDLLRRFNLVINYPVNEIHLSPNSHFKDLFDYSYTGMTLYFVDNEVIIDDIIKGSPADKAGFENGDVIIAIDNNLSKNIETYKNLLQRTGQKISIFITRDKVPMLIYLHVGKVR